MGENSQVFQILQVGAEANNAHGTPVAAGKLLQDILFRPDIEYEGDSFTPAGYMFPTTNFPNREWGSAQIEGKPGYNSLAYVLHSLLKSVTPARNIPSTGLSYLHTFAPSSAAEETVQSYTVEYGSADRAEKYAYGLVNGLELGGTRQALTLGGSMLFQKMTDGITLTTTPTAVSPVLVLPDQGNVYIADTQVGLASATALTRVFEWKASLADRFAPLWQIRSADTSWAAHGFQTPKSSVMLKMALNSDNAAFLTAMRAGASKWLRIKYTGAKIEDDGGTPAVDYNYYFQIDCKIGVANPDKRDSVDSVATRGWNFVMQHDATWGKALEVKLQNTIASL